MSIPTLIYCWPWVITSYELGCRWSSGGWRRRILGYCMAGDFFDCFEVVAGAKKSKKKKGKKRNIEGDKGNEE